MVAMVLGLQPFGFGFESRRRHDCILFGKEVGLSPVMDSRLESNDASDGFFTKNNPSSAIFNFIDHYYSLQIVSRLITCNFGFVDSNLGIFDVKDASRTGRPIVGNVDKITEIINIDRHVNSRSIAQGSC
ncbi:hypothetical protein TNCV_1928741 [Trichonephila clavipes]|nr:hypothetical protein TNCV_1928741 [Trichonephila clavipes]